MLAHSSLRSLLLAPLFLAGCGDSLAPGALSGSYALQRVAGDPVPTVVATNEYGTILVFSETIHLGPHGAGTISSVIEMVPHNIFLPREGPSPAESEIRWTMRKGRVEIEYVCGPLANCAPGPHLVGVLSGQTLRLSWRPQSSGRAPLEYVEALAAQ
jgi:hypothetical protein